MENNTYSGILKVVEGDSFVETTSGEKIFENERIWNGYLKHWKDTKVNARRLSQLDYEEEQPIIIMWPNEQKPKIPFVQIYYNERLVQYFDSSMGHLAINVNGKIFNFAKKYNENEVITREEYFYRPALGEFAPSPTTGKQEISQTGRSYFHKFGRNFMRSVHVLHIEGVDTDILCNILMDELEVIHNTPAKPGSPEDYPDFHFIKRSCTSIVRDGLRKYGYKNLKGVIPRDFFVNVSYNLTKETSLITRLYKMPQMVVSECPQSKPTFLFNILNWHRNNILKYQN